MESQTTPPPPVPLEPRPPKSPVPLASTQVPPWHVVTNKGTKRSKLRYCAASWRIHGPLDVPRLQRSIERLVHRHESLRTRIVAGREGPRQIVDPPRTFELPLIDLSGKSAAGERDAARLAKAFIDEEIDVGVDPLFAARVLRLSETDHVVLLGVDHFVSDAVSFSIISREVLTLYSQADENPERALPRVTVQFPDFAVWQAKTHDWWSAHHAPYWLNRLSKVQKVCVPVDHPLSPDPSYSNLPPAEFWYIPLGTQLTEGLQSTARCERTLLPLVVLSIQLIVMSLWCDRRDLLVELFSHGRGARPELKEMVGFLAHPLYLRVEVVPNETFRDLVRRVTEEFYQACAHDPARVTANLLLSEFPTELAFNWISSGWGETAHPPFIGEHLDLWPFTVSKRFSVIFGPHWYHTPSGVVGEIWQGRGLFERRTLEWFEHQLRSIAQSVVRNPDTRIASAQGAP